jgi:hypothetical protein
LQKHKEFSDFKVRTDLCKDGATLLKIMSDFRRFYGLEAFSFKEIDKFLWLKGESPVDSESLANAPEVQEERRVEFGNVNSD